MTDAAYKTARRMSYIRWRLKTSKPVTEKQRKKLNEYDAEISGAYAEVLDRLSFDDIGNLARLRADKLKELAVDASLVQKDETVTKKEIIARVKVFQQYGLRAAKAAA